MLEMTPVAEKQQHESVGELASLETLTPSEDSPTQSEQTLARLRLLWMKRWFLIRAATIGFLAATLLAFLIPKQYESTAQLMPPDSQSPSSLALLAGLTGAGGLGMLAGDLLGIQSTGALFVGVLRSRTVEDRIVDRFDLKKVYAKSLQMEARKKLAERTAITEDRRSGIITLTVTDGDPKRAAAIASAYVEELNTLIAQLSTSSAHRERVFLEDRLDTVKQDLGSAEKDFSQFASSKGAIDIAEQGKAMVQGASTLEGQLIAVESEFEGLRQIYTDDNIRVRSAQARIDELRHELGKLGGKAGGASESSDDSPSEVPYPTLRQLPIIGVPFADKLRRLTVEEAVFETLTKQYELAKVQEAKEIPSVKVLDVPVVPEHKSFPPRLLIAMLGSVCTALFSVIWVLGTFQWQEIDPQDPAKTLAREVFHAFAARIPCVSRSGARESAAKAETVEKEAQNNVSASAGS